MISRTYLSMISHYILTGSCDQYFSLHPHWKLWSKPLTTIYLEVVIQFFHNYITESCDKNLSLQYFWRLWSCSLITTSLEDVIKNSHYNIPGGCDGACIDRYSSAFINPMIGTSDACCGLAWNNLWLLYFPVPEPTGLSWNQHQLNDVYTISKIQKPVR